jgi:subtilisin family serine protease
MNKLLFFVFLFATVNTWSQKQKKSNILPGQYIVVLKASIATPLIKSGLNTNRGANSPNKELREQINNKIKELHAKHKLNPKSILFTYTDAIVGFSAKLTAEEVKRLKNDPWVEAVYEDRELQLEQTPAVEIKNAMPAQGTDCAIITSGGHTDGSSKPTWIWIIDTGIDTDHPDLNVQTKAPYALSFVGGSVEDLMGHGTHVAGIAAAKDNDFGVVGMSAGAKVVPIKVFPDINVTNFSLIIAALNHIANFGIPGDVINISISGDGGLGCTPMDPTFRNAMVNLANAGIWICSAAGNNGDNATFYLPGCINSTRIFTVAALDCGNTCAAYSNLNGLVDWYAVGTNVVSTYKDGGYAALTGTSMATPVVAGIIHSRGQAPIKGPLINCPDFNNTSTILPIARRQ